jgi:hypothetical protein
MAPQTDLQGKGGIWQTARMFLRSFLGRLTLVMIAGAGGGNMPALEPRKDEAPTAWPVRSFPLPREFSRQIGISRPLPSPDAGETVWVERVRRDTGEFKEALKRMGTDLPDHTAVLLDPPNEAVAVRTMVEPMEEIEDVLAGIAAQRPSTLAFVLDSYRVDGATARSVAHEAAGRSEVSGILRKLRDLANSGKAQQLPPIYLETRSDQRGVRQSGEGRTTVTKVSLDSEGNVFTETESLPGETSLEIEPVLGPDDHMIDVNISLMRPFGAQVHRSIFVGETSAGRVEVPVMDSQRGKVTTAVTIGSGRTKLLSIWPVGDALGKDGHEIVFLRGEAVKVATPAANQAPLEKLMSKYANKAAGKPPEVKALPNAPSDGMRTQRFKVPPNFLRGGGSAPAPPADPFAPVERTPHGRLTAVDMLMANGIQFPSGASAKYFPGTNTLVVRNTELGLSQVEALTDEINKILPRAVQFTLFIAQAGAKTLRASVGAMATKADHGKELADLEKLAAQGVAQIPVILRYETRSGQRATLDSGTMHKYAGDLQEEPRKAADAKKPEDPPAKDEGAASSSKIVSAPIRRRMVGTRIEIDPVIGPDGVTLDINLSMEHHFAAPTLPAAPAKVNAAGKQLELPGAIFHCANLTSAVTLYSGMTKLLGVWKAEGPDFEGKDVMQAAFLRVDLVEEQ